MLYCIKYECSESYTAMYLHVLVCTVYGTYILVLVHPSIYLDIRFRAELYHSIVQVPLSSYN